MKIHFFEGIVVFFFIFFDVEISTIISPGIKISTIMELVHIFCTDKLNRMCSGSRYFVGTGMFWQFVLTWYIKHI